MTDLLAARLQMGISLGFHILFAVAGIAMPVFMVAAEWRHRRTGLRVFRELAERWSKGTAILFAVGAVSGTVLSFELGLLWPTFMEHAGPLIGMPFSLEAFAFFLEAIALGIYLYGWDRVSPTVHLLSGALVAVSGLASGVFVVAVNAWMNTPQGFRVDGAGRFTDIDLWQAFFTPAFPTQALHTTLAAYASLSFAVLGIHAARLLADPKAAFHRAAFTVLLPFAIVTAPLQALSGDLSAKHIAQTQPVKLAAAEALFESQAGAPITVGGWPDEERERVKGGIEIPKLLSLLATGDPEAHITGLKEFPRELRPPVAVVHLAFDLMVGAGSILVLVAASAVWLLARRRHPADSRWFLYAATCAAPLGLIAVEAGWVVTEVGRQPWIVHDVLLVRDAVTPVPHLLISLIGTVVLYVTLGIVVVFLLARHVLSSPTALPSTSSTATSRLTDA